MTDRKSYPDSFKDTLKTSAGEIPEIEDVYNGPDIEAVYAGPDMWDDNYKPGIPVNDGSVAGIINEGAEVVKEIAENA